MKAYHDEVSLVICVRQSWPDKICLSVRLSKSICLSVRLSIWQKFRATWWNKAIVNLRLKWNEICENDILTSRYASQAVSQLEYATKRKLAAFELFKNFILYYTVFRTLKFIRMILFLDTFLSEIKAARNYCTLLLSGAHVHTRAESGGRNS